MKVKMVFASQFCGHAEEIVEVPDASTDEEIKALFPEGLGIPFYENACYYEVL